MFLLIATAMAMAAALTFGIAAVIEQLSTKRVQRRRALSPRLLVDLAQQPLWVVGICADLGGFVLQVIALRFGPLALVEPILVCDLIFAALISAALTSRWDAAIITGVVACAAGVAAFLVIARPSGGGSAVSLSAAAPLAAGLAAAVAGCLVLAGTSRRLRPLALALACGINYGVAAFLVKLITSGFGGLAQLLSHWPVYALVVIGPLGFLLNQNAFQQGTLIAPVLAVITASDPLVSIGLGHFWLNEALTSSAAGVAGAVASLLVMIAGIIVLAQRAPLVTGTRSGLECGRSNVVDPGLSRREPQHCGYRPRGGRLAPADRLLCRTSPGSAHHATPAGTRCPDRESRKERPAVFVGRQRKGVTGGLYTRPPTARPDRPQPRLVVPRYPRQLGPGGAGIGLPVILIGMPVELPEDCVALLRQQCGVIARWQAETAGLTPGFVRAKVRAGRWQRLYRGVYAAFTGEPPRAAWQWAALLRAGEGAALSHYTAAEIDRLTERASDVVHVTVGHDRRVRFDEEARAPSAPRIKLHRSGRIAASRHPARTPPRTRIPETLIDLTQLAVNFDDVLGWLSRGCGRGLTTPDQLRSAVAARPKMRWRREILVALGDVAEGAHSPLEYHFVHGVEQAHGLPTAKRQVRLQTETGRRYLDNLYAGFAVGVELDGQAYHPAETRWDDLHRDNYCAVVGLIILRYSWADVTARRCSTAAELARVLTHRGWPGPIRQCDPCCGGLSMIGDTNGR